MVENKEKWYIESRGKGNASPYQAIFEFKNGEMFRGCPVVLMEGYIGSNELTQKEYDTFSDLCVAVAKHPLSYRQVTIVGGTQTLDEWVKINGGNDKPSDNLSLSNIPLSQKMSQKKIGGHLREIEAKEAVERTTGNECTTTNKGSEKTDFVENAKIIRPDGTKQYQSLRHSVKGGEIHDQIFSYTYGRMEKEFKPQHVLCKYQLDHRDHYENIHQSVVKVYEWFQGFSDEFGNPLLTPTDLNRQNALRSFLRFAWSNDGEVDRLDICGLRGDKKWYGFSMTDVIEYYAQVCKPNISVEGRIGLFQTTKLWSPKKNGDYKPRSIYTLELRHDGIHKGELKLYAKIENLYYSLMSSGLTYMTYE